MKSFLKILGILFLSVYFAAPSLGASQGGYDLPEPYMGWEKAYLKEFPDLQKVMDVMIQKTVAQIKDPDQDILHNRVCSALVYKMAREQNLSREEQKLAIAGDLLHNISKEEKEAVLTKPELLAQTGKMVEGLRNAGYLKKSKKFWSDEAVFKNPKVGDNRGLIHHITGAWMAGEILSKIGGFSEKDIQRVQAAILEHSTGYWYFRASVNDAVGKADAWEVVFPEPDHDIAKFAHDADLISQFVPESVVPDGSKWRGLAQKRWGAKDAKEEGHIVYYVFLRLFEEAKTPSGKKMAQEQWEKIRPELIKLMGFKPDQDPVKELGVPKIFQK